MEKAKGIDRGGEGRCMKRWRGMIEGDEKRL